MRRRAQRGHTGSRDIASACSRQNRRSISRRIAIALYHRMLGNGYCARPVEMDCQFESICESCTFFVTTLEFRRTLQKQRDDAGRTGQPAAVQPRPHLW